MESPLCLDAVEIPFGERATIAFRRCYVSCRPMDLKSVPRYRRGGYFAIGARDLGDFLEAGKVVSFFEFVEVSIIVARRATTSERVDGAGEDLC